MLTVVAGVLRRVGKGFNSDHLHTVGGIQRVADRCHCGVVHTVIDNLSNAIFTNILVSETGGQLFGVVYLGHILPDRADGCQIGITGIHFLIVDQRMNINGNAVVNDDLIWVSINQNDNCKPDNGISGHIVGGVGGSGVVHGSAFHTHHVGGLFAAGISADNSIVAAAIILDRNAVLCSGIIQIIAQILNIPGGIHIGSIDLLFRAINQEIDIGGIGDLNRSVEAAGFTGGKVHDGLTVSIYNVETVTNGRLLPGELRRGNALLGRSTAVIRVIQCCGLVGIVDARCTVALLRASQIDIVAQSQLSRGDGTHLPVEGFGR